MSHPEGVLNNGISCDDHLIDDTGNGDVTITPWQGGGYERAPNFVFTTLSLLTLPECTCDKSKLHFP